MLYWTAVTAVALIHIMFGVFITLLWQDRHIWSYPKITGDRDSDALLEQERINQEMEHIESQIDGYIESQVKPWK